MNYGCYTYYAQFKHALSPSNGSLWKQISSRTHYYAITIFFHQQIWAITYSSFSVVAFFWSNFISWSKPLLTAHQLCQPNHFHLDGSLQQRNRVLLPHYFVHHHIRVILVSQHHFCNNLLST